jgi:hypothetical protein
VSAAPESLGVATIQVAEVWGKAYYGTGVDVDTLVGQYSYLFVETYDIQGNMKLAISGASDQDFYDVTPNVVAGDTGDPNVIYNPGPYVFDVSGWGATNHPNVSMQLIAEGGSGQGFTVNRLFFTDDLGDTPFGEVPEPSTALFVSLGLVGGLIARKRARR